MLILKAFGMLC